MTKKKSPPPTLTTDPFRVYDQALLDTFADLVVVGEGGKLEPVNINFATPRREFASQTTVAADPNKVEPITGLAAATSRRAARTVPYPTASITRMSPIFDNSRFVAQTIRKLRVMDRNRAWLHTRFPLPYDIQYQLDIRAKYRTHLNQLINGVQLKFFEPFIPLSVVWGEPFEDKHVYLAIEPPGIQDNSILEQESETSDPVLRATVTMVLKAWFLQRVSTTPTALKIMHDLYVIETWEPFEQPDRAPDFTVIETADQEV